MGRTLHERHGRFAAASRTSSRTLSSRTSSRTPSSSGRGTPEPENRRAPRRAASSSSGSFGRSTSSISSTASSTAAAAARRLANEGNVFHDAVNNPRALEFVSRLEARASRYGPARRADAFANAWNAKFTGRPAGEAAAARRAAARARWRRAIDASRPSKAKLVDAVRHAYDALDQAAKASGYSGLTRLVQKNLAAALVGEYRRLRGSVRDQARFVAVRSGLEECVQLATGAFLGSAPAYVASHAVLWGWRAACDRSAALKQAAGVASDRFQRAVDASMRVVWAGVGRAAPWALSVAFDNVVRSRLTAWVRRADPRLVGSVDFDVVSAVLRRHRALVGAVLIGEDASLRPLVVDLARALDACVVQAVLARFLPHHALTPECRARK